MVEPTGRAARKSSSSTSTMKKSKVPEKKKQKQSRQCAAEPAESPSYRLALKSLFSCRNSSHAPAAPPPPSDRSSKQPSKTKQLGCGSAPSICKVNKDSSDNRSSSATDEKRRASSVSEKTKPPLTTLSDNAKDNNKLQGSSSSSSSTGGGSFRAGMQLRRLSGCYECHMVVDPSSSMRAAAICSCPDCGEIFVRQESLQLHQSIRHAVCELGSDDTSRNIIEIIFQSSWLKKQSPVCRIQRILKVHNSARTLARFEEYRDAVKAKARKKHPRCTADGNELLRFHCAALGCSLGLHGATHLCGACATCAIIRDGFTAVDAAGGIRTMATSGRAHDACATAKEDDEQSSSSSSCCARAMLVCRVIAGRVKRPEEEQVHDREEEEEEEEEEEFESVASSAGVYSNMEELQVFNPRAILPCFVVIYKAAAP